MVHLNYLFAKETQIDDFNLLIYINPKKIK